MRWVIATAARQIACWDAELGRPAAAGRSQRLPPPTRRLRPHRPARAAAGDAGIHPGRLVVEITESALDTDEDSLLRALRRLKRLGVDIALDDFGTGYSSLSHLRLLPIDELKIDQSFVRGVATSHRDRDLITAIVQMGRALRLRTLAEGVETADQAAALHALGCDIGQGFLYARPAPAPAVLAYLRTRQRHTRLALVDSTTRFRAANQTSVIPSTAVRRPDPAPNPERTARPHDRPDRPAARRRTRIGRSPARPRTVTRRGLRRAGRTADMTTMDGLQAGGAAGPARPPRGTGDPGPTASRQRTGRAVPRPTGRTRQRSVSCPARRRRRVEAGGTGCPPAAPGRGALGRPAGRCGWSCSRPGRRCC